jgi:hypothetical protein
LEVEVIAMVFGMQVLLVTVVGSLLLLWVMVAVSYILLEDMGGQVANTRELE